MAPCNRPSTGRNTCMALRACSVGRCIFPAALHRKLSILAGASRNGKVTLEGFINHLVSRHLEEYRETTDMILEESLPGRS